MIIQAELRRKQSEYEGDACVVDKVIELPAQRFQQFSRALLADYDFIAENKMPSGTMMVIGTVCLSLMRKERTVFSLIRRAITTPATALLFQMPAVC